MKKNHWIKVISIWLFYVALHFTYKIAPCDLTQLFGCPVETIFHHMKMAFLSYSLISIVEYFIRKPKKLTTFISTRMISAILFSYFSFVIWFILPVIFGPIEVEWFEVVYSNIILALSLGATIYLESFIEKVSFNKAITIVVSILFLIILTVFVISAYQTPHIGVFTPHGH